MVRAQVEKGIALPLSDTELRARANGAAKALLSLEIGEGRHVSDYNEVVLKPTTPKLRMGTDFTSPDYIQGITIQRGSAEITVGFADTAAMNRAVQARDRNATVAASYSQTTRLYERDGTPMLYVNRMGNEPDYVLAEAPREYVESVVAAVELIELGKLAVQSAR